MTKSDTAEYWDDIHNAYRRPSYLQKGVCECATPNPARPGSRHCKTCRRYIKETEKQNETR